MSNFRQAPKLYHSEKKEKGIFYQLPQRLMDCVFNQLSGREGNQIKLISVLLGTAGDGSFAVSEKYICDRTGMDQPSYSRARKALVDKGWLKMEKGSLCVDIKAIQSKSEKTASSHPEDMSSDSATCDNNIAKTCDNSIYNKEKQKINNIKRINNDFVDAGLDSEGDGSGEIPEHILKRMRELGIDFQQNSVAVLEKIIGGKLNFYILNDLVNRHQADFVKAKGQPANYIFGILKNKVAAEYRKEEHKREVQCMQEEWDREQRRLQPQINWDYLFDMRSKHEKEDGVLDVSDLLDDDDDEDDDLCSSEAPTGSVAPKSLELLEQLTAERAVAEDDDSLW